MPEKRRERIRRRKRRRIRRRFFRRIRWQRNRKRRCGVVCLAAAVLVYLFLAWCGNHKGFSVQEEYVTEFYLPANQQEQDVFRIRFRWKTGEVLFFHESRRIDNANP